MKKILFLATYPYQSNGYAKIANKITNFLADFYDIYYFGFSNYKDTFVKREVHENIKIIDVVEEEKKRGLNDAFGVEIIEETINQINPDIIIIYNDIIVTCNHLNVLNNLRYEKGYNFKVMSYLDLVYEYEKPLYIDFVNRHVDFICVFSECWKNNLIKMGIKENKIEVIPHGLNENVVKLDKSKCREELGLNEKDFIILNANRNSYRKATYLTVSSFVKFLKKCISENESESQRIKLLLHCDMDNKTGYDISEITKIECIKEGLDYDRVVNHHIIRLSNIRIDDETMIKLYNACDMGINTCVGEGFGLCSFEHISLGKPQVVSNVGAHKDIFEGYSEFTVNPVCEYYISPHTDTHVGFIEICSAKDFSQKMSVIYNYYRKYEIISEKFSKNIRVKYDWNNILGKFKGVIEGL
jgi:glycosyltransferase involved in cell wall biosynthesis